MRSNVKKTVKVKTRFPASPYDIRSFKDGKGFQDKIDSRTLYSAIRRLLGSFPDDTYHIRIQGKKSRISYFLSAKSHLEIKYRGRAK